MLHLILQFGFAAIALACLVAALLRRGSRGPLLWAAASAGAAAIGETYHVAWALLAFGLMSLWAIFTALPVMNIGWRLKVGLTTYLLVGAGICLYPTLHDEILGKDKLEAYSAEERAEIERQSKQGELGFGQYLRSNLGFRLVRGLDLKGGLRLVYTVDVEEAIKDKRDRYYDDLRVALTKHFPDVTGYTGDAQPANEQMEKLISVAKLVKEQGRFDSVVVTFEDTALADKVDQEFLSRFLLELQVRRSSDRKELTFRIKTEVVTDARSRAVEQAKQTIHRRVDSLGLKEAAVSSRDEDIIVEMPGDDAKAFEEIKSIISETARLEFKLLDDEQNPFEAFAKRGLDEPGIAIEFENAPVGPGRTKPVYYARLARHEGEAMEEALKRFRDWVGRQMASGVLQVDQNHEVGYEKWVEYEPDTGEYKDVGWRTYFLWSKAEITGDMVRNAQAASDQSEGGLGGWNVQLTFTQPGGEIFERITEANVKRRFAIILDGKTESTPEIREKIGGGTARITMGAGSIDQQLQNAKKLELVLKSGALPAPISLSNSQVIGPSLGNDAIDKGVTAALVGAGLVLLIMLYFYHAAGMIANLAVLLNLVLQVAALAMFGASLTLPGITGLALTIGMAVDANVLINERIREELAMGKSPRAAVAVGYDKAFAAILDGHVTTLITALILAQYGSGPIKGFAVTLIVGVTCSLFTGVVVTKLFFEFWVRRRHAKLSLG
ncbi:MAG: protein translocase subunit SecD [Myxococcales bacterium]|nr:protein translocase subunit SecD [Myxococcales bacterium]